MMPQHAEVYRGLTADETAHLWRALHDNCIVADEPPPTPPDPEQLLRVIGELSHAEVVLSLSRDTTEIGLQTVEKLIERPIYLCARGETSEPLTDIEGRPLRLPIGHRRGEPPGTGSPSVLVRSRMRARASRRDNRVITAIVPNPKQPGSDAFRRFKLYKVGLTCDECIALGVTRPDINWDARRGFITLGPPRS
jgi:hypothetical protein